MTKVLVAYGTKHGSTQQVAEAVAATIRDRGADVEVVAARQVRDPVDTYSLVVLGAPLYNGRWYRDAHRFLKRHRTEVGRVPVAVFGMGPRDSDEESWRHSRAQLDRALARRGWFAPVAVTVFGGVDPPGRRGPHRDIRDWTDIRGWAEGLPLPAADRPAGTG